MNAISISSDLKNVLSAVIRDRQIQITLEHAGPGEITISLIFPPSVEGTMSKDTLLALEVLLKNMIFPSPGNPVGPVEQTFYKGKKIMIDSLQEIIDSIRIIEDFLASAESEQIPMKIRAELVLLCNLVRNNQAIGQLLKSSHELIEDAQDRYAFHDDQPLKK